jgi:predicted KAP-like P-loop ATPase
MADESNLTSLLSADRPIDDLEEDRLRRKDFAKNIARIFGEWKGRDSLVVALYGPWGAGKTSLKNLVLRSLAENRSQGPKATEILEFNPWQWSGHSELTSAFFGEVERAIGRTVGSKSAVRTMQILRAYAAFLGASRAVLEGVPKLLASTILLIGALGFGASISQGLAEVGPVIGAVIFGALTVAGILGLSEAVLERAAAWVSARIAVNSKTLSEYKKDLADELRKLNRNILVIIDDIDRLTPEEIRTVFQLVKANADFPNFIYFLPFQRSLVAKALNPDNAAEGDQFLEKIVQIGFDIPGVGQADIDGILEEKLNVLFASEMSANRFDKERWINLQQTGLRHYFPDLRRVNRFAGSLPQLALSSLIYHGLLS